MKIMYFVDYCVGIVTEEWFEYYNKVVEENDNCIEYPECDTDFCSVPFESFDKAKSFVDMLVRMMEERCKNNETDIVARIEGVHIDNGTTQNKDRSILLIDSDKVFLTLWYGTRILY